MAKLASSDSVTRLEMSSSRLRSAWAARRARSKASLRCSNAVGSASAERPPDDRRCCAVGSASAERPPGDRRSCACARAAPMPATSTASLASTSESVTIAAAVLQCTVRDSRRRAALHGRARSRADFESFEVRAWRAPSLFRRRRTVLMALRARVMMRLPREQTTRRFRQRPGCVSHAFPGLQDRERRLWRHYEALRALPSDDRRALVKVATVLQSRA